MEFNANQKIVFQDVHFKYVKMQKLGWVHRWWGENFSGAGGNPGHWGRHNPTCRLCSWGQGQLLSLILLMVWNLFPSSKNGSNWNDFESAMYDYWLILYGPMSAFRSDTSSCPCAQGLSVNPGRWLCRRKWNRGATHPGRKQTPLRLSA